MPESKGRKFNQPESWWGIIQPSNWLRKKRLLQNHKKQANRRRADPHLLLCCLMHPAVPKHRRLRLDLQFQSMEFLSPGCHKFHPHPCWWTGHISYITLENFWRTWRHWWLKEMAVIFKNGTGESGNSIIYTWEGSEVEIIRNQASVAKVTLPHLIR